MGEAIGQVLSLAVGVALSPVPIIGVTLMLATPRARSNGLAFIGGWIAGLAIAGAVFLLLSGSAGAGDGGEPAEWVGMVKLVLGALLLLVAARQWQSRPDAGAEAPMPKWMQSIDRFRAPKAAGSGRPRLAALGGQPEEPAPGDGRGRGHLAGPAQTTGVMPTKRTSAAKHTDTSGTQTIVSPTV